MKFYKFIVLFLICGLFLSSCQATPTNPTQSATSAQSSPDPLAINPTVSPTQTSAPIPTDSQPIYKDASASIDARVADLLARMSLEEKIGQMTQIEKNSLKSGDVARYLLGSVLSGGGGSPPFNDTEHWAEMVNAFQEEALSTRLGIPMIYGVDAVHGHGNLYGATIFPQNIGLGAANDSDLTFRIGKATAAEMAATSIFWNFAPVIAVVQDIRWGRTYEGFSESTEIVTSLGEAYIRGLQEPTQLGSDPLPYFVLATPKHYIGDGGTTWGTSTTSDYMIDQGVTEYDEAQLRALFLPPYQAAVESGALIVMNSFSSWGGTKMSANQYLLTDVLKNELSFKGFIVSDWASIDQVNSNYYQANVDSINAGIDMSMVPYDATRFIAAVKTAVESGAIPMERIDDAVRRILYVKFALGLFERPYADPTLQTLVGSDEHRALAREAVAKSLVLLKNDNAALPLSKDTPLIFVAGKAADDIGIQCGGWTIQWQGRPGNITPGTTILDAISTSLANPENVRYDLAGKFDNVTDASGSPLIAEVGIAVVGELPYAEGVGDASSLDLPENQITMLERMRLQVKTLVVIIISGRPLIITDQLDLADAWVAAWLPGTEALGITDVLFGDLPFTGKLPYTWPRSYDQLPLNINNLAESGQEPLFEFGYGLQP